MPAGKMVTLPSAPVVGTDATNKKYVDSVGKLYLSLDGGTMNGNITMPAGTAITLTSEPKNPTDAVNIAYLDKIRNISFRKEFNSEYLASAGANINPQISQDRMTNSTITSTNTSHTITSLGAKQCFIITVYGTTNLDDVINVEIGTTTTSFKISANFNFDFFVDVPSGSSTSFTIKPTKALTISDVTVVFQQLL